jgi:ATP-binding cassette, subfamily B, bacterial PglK
MKNFKKFIYLLSAQERKQGSLLLMMIILMALLEMVGVASIMPFTAILVNPEIIETNYILNLMFDYSSIFGIETKKQFIFTLGFLVFILLITSNFFKAFTYYFQSRFTNMREYSISKRLVENYLHQPYSWFLNRNSADLGKSILSEVGLIIGHGLQPMMELIAKSFVAITLIILLILIDPKIALMAGFILGTAYLLVYKFTRTYLNVIGKDRAKANELRFTVINEAFGASKEVKVGGLEQHYVKRFEEPAKIYSRNVANASIVGGLPRYALEIIIFGGMLFMILFLMAQTGSFVNVVPIIALYAFACYRLIPALQSIYAATTQLRFITPALDALYKDIKSLKPIITLKDKNILTINKKISLRNVDYNYPNTSRTALKNINITITAKNTIGIVGATGSGKTTMVDIILGIIEAQKGTLEVDGEIITQLNSRTWQRSIGYVPQHIYLSDDTIAANIAFGVELKNINLEAVEKASKIANLHEFVIGELPKQYQSTIGERGVRLSGGQRQRIGIARALYHNPQILILDEATSALDNQTEKAVMDAINNLGKNITIILIAHRLSTVKKCDRIFLLEKGELKNEGTFEELLKIDKSFRMNVNN